MGVAGRLSFTETKNVKNACKQLALWASEEADRPDAVTETSQLGRMYSFLEIMDRAVNSKTMSSGIPQLKLRQADFNSYPLFDTFRRDENTESLAGPAELPPMFRPVEFTHVTERVTNFAEFTEALRHADSILLV